MPLITDTFPAPALDPLKWTDVQAGTVALFVGTPVDGVYSHGVDEHGDSVFVESDGKIQIPAGIPFEQRVYYEDVYEDPEQTVSLSLGWRSELKSGGIPLWGVDVALTVQPGGVFLFQKGEVLAGIGVRSTIIIDPSSGASGAFRVTRIGSTYGLYYRAGGWVHLTDVVLPYNGPGFARFGIEAFDAAIVFPWIFQT